MSTTFDTPVAFFIFNRPRLTEKVFAVITQAKPRQLFVVADGARFDDERERCEQTRSIIQRVDWECDLRIDFSDTNLGCRRRISTGLDWVFSQVEEVIILEDDCLPHPSFFGFCEELLERYRDDERIMHIGGANFQKGNNLTPYSYYFSRITHSWAWATWRRAWRHYDVDMASWPENRTMIANFFDEQVERNYFLDMFDQVYHKKIDTWDYQWLYCCLSQGGLGITPHTNLVTNIGWGAESTHNMLEDHPAAYLRTSDIGPICHPSSVIVHRAADLYTMDNIWGLAASRNPEPPPLPVGDPDSNRFTALKSRMVESFKYRVIRGGK